MLIKTSKKNYGGFGLLESVVAVGVFGVTIVMGLSLIVKSLRVIKENQVSDQAASVMISSLEYVRSSVDVVINGGYYTVVISSDGKVTGIQETLGNSLTLGNCNTSSVFYIDIDGDDSFGTFCNQISVEYADPLQPDISDYLIRSSIVYKISDGYKFRESIGFKSRHR